MSRSAPAYPVETAEILSGVESTIRRFVKAIAVSASVWATARANYLANAAIYKQLTRLSDAELHRRGLSRSTLARDVSGTFDGS